jgi:hypothetical protein
VVGGNRGQLTRSAEAVLQRKSKRQHFPDKGELNNFRVSGCGYEEKT